MAATSQTIETSKAEVRPPRTLTLLELVSEVAHLEGDEVGVVASVMELVSSRRVHLIGQVVDEDLLED